MSKKTRLMVLCYMVLCSHYACAQFRVLGIEEMFRLADANSKSIQTFRTGKAAADEALRAAKAQRLPDLSASASVSYWGNGRLWDRDFGNGRRIDMPHFGNNFALEATQVVYAGGAIRSGIALAELGQQLAELDWQKNRQEIRFLLTGYYLELYKLDNQTKVLKDNLYLTDRVIQNVRARREQGTALKNDITRYELQREQLLLQLEQVQDARKVMNHHLVTTLHLPDDVRVLPDTTLLDTPIEALAEEDWQIMAGQHNLDLRQAKVQVEVNKQQLRQVRAVRLPQISLVAVDHLDGPITIEVPVLDNNFNYWYVGLGVKYSFSSLFKNTRKLQQARLHIQQAKEREELAREQLENAVQAGYTHFLTAFTDLRTQEKSVRLADENYAVVNNRYINEMALLTDMLDASNMKLSADLALVNARINVIYHYYQMKYLTHTL